LWLQRVPEEDEEIYITLSDHRTDLLVPAERTTHERFNIEPEFALESTPRRSSRMEAVLCQHLMVVARPCDEVRLAIVVGDQDYPSGTMLRRQC